MFRVLDIIKISTSDMRQILLLGLCLAVVRGVINRTTASATPIQTTIKTTTTTVTVSNSSCGSSYSLNELNDEMTLKYDGGQLPQRCSVAISTSQPGTNLCFDAKFENVYYALYSTLSYTVEYHDRLVTDYGADKIIDRVSDTSERCVSSSKVFVVFVSGRGSTDYPPEIEIKIKVKRFLNVTVSNSSCGSSYSLNGLNDEMTLKYDGGQLPQRCSVAISTSQPGANLCFDAKFENVYYALYSILSYTVEYHDRLVTDYGADKIIDRVSDTSEWCVSSSKVFVVFVSGRGSTDYPPEIEIKIKVKRYLNVTVSNSSCGSSYSLNGLNDEMTLKYDGGQLPQKCSVAISTSQPGANMCFDAKFENVYSALYSTLSYTVEYHDRLVTDYRADKIIDRVSDTSEWCVSSSKVFVVFVSGRGSTDYPPEIEIKIKVKRYLNVIVSNSSCGSSYSLNGLNDGMTLKYDGGQLPQRCSVAILTSQPGANLCFDAKFENVYYALFSTLSYTVEYHDRLVTDYRADKTINSIWDTSEWCVLSSKVFVVFVSERGSSDYQSEIEIKIKVKDNVISRTTPIQTITTTTAVTVSSSSCDSSYPLNGLNDEMTLQYNGRQLPQGCSVTISTSQPGANLCFKVKFDNTYLTLSYKVEYHKWLVTEYADKTIDSISDTSEWCVLSSKVFVVFVSAGGSSFQPNIEIKIKVTDSGLSSVIGSAVGWVVGVVGVVVGVACVGGVIIGVKRHVCWRGQVVPHPPTTTAPTPVQLMIMSAPTPAVYQGYPQPSQTGYQPQQGYHPPSQTGYQLQQGFPQTSPAGYQPYRAGYQPGGYQQQTSYPPATKAGYTRDQTGYPHEPQRGYAGKQQSASPSYSPSVPPAPSVPPQPSVPPEPSVPPQPSVPPPPYSP
ncbi:uncharacterized protein LOC127877631 isoform X3 [Dreissena polymorpha]|uniref:uncharacterized protein LOC127877631 isoform X3 n=2 Tax=Dreissena polymorpha TaxID=45954 RepID=UPI002264E095|nr:uncharacterized protein LOC127877631 isoform X3 [Dreissena polymorpha]